VGTVLAAFPGKHRRRPTDPVSAPVPLDDDAVTEPSVAAALSPESRPGGDGV
jgi:hypothetical protein